MTIAANNTAEMNIGQIILQAYQQAGLMELSQSPTGPQWEARAAFARGCFQRVLQRMGADGPFMRQVEFYTLTLTQGVSEYTMPSDTIDVIGEGAHRELSSDIETMVRPIDREEWNATPDKTTQAIPFRMFVQRGQTVTINFLQVPPTTGSTVRLQRQKLYADVKANSDTPDLERYWVDALVWTLALMVAWASSLPMERIQGLKSESSEAIRLAKSKAQQQVPNQLHLMHTTGWNR